MPLCRDVWEVGIEHELKFWRSFLEKRGHQYEVDRLLSPQLGFMLNGKGQVDIADIGSGAVSLIGNVSEGIAINVFPSDVLADKYAQLCNELGIKPLITVAWQDMTCLSYGDGQFDIVHCANALDHCHNPFRAISEMVRVCKPGGWVYLRHIPHEGKRRGYKGLHKWNIDRVEYEDCEFWTRNREDSFLLSECYAGFSTQIVPGGRASRIVSFIQKRSL